ncbi:MAG: DUF4886 domain-containing protein [Clostridia bacterium]|nr:DUF4886 domain-containing protein [Clostridia bacterium]
MMLLLLCVCLLLPLYACNQPDEPSSEQASAEQTSTQPETQPEQTDSTEQTTEQPPVEDLEKDWDEDGVLKILCIGNSFSVDSMEYLYGILQDLGIAQIKLGNLAIGGCTVNTHASNAKKDTPDYLYYENTSGTWSVTEGNVLSEKVKSENWDYISVQQASHDSGLPNTYRKLPELLSLLSEMAPDAHIVWNMTWAYQQDSTHGSFHKYDSDQMTMYEKILTTVQDKVQSEEIIKKVIPCGTAIQNARAGWIGDTLTRDGFHLSNTGRYIAALTFAQTLTGRSVEGVTYAPAGITQAEQTLAIEAAMLAVQTPFAVSVPTAQAPKQPGIEDLYELEIEFVRGYYHACEPGGRHWNRIQGSDLANQFYSTQIFTKETLPAGSIIVLAEGWQYRPEGWIEDAALAGSLRPASTNTAMIVIDELWWGDFNYRAFNVSKTPLTSLLDMSEEDMQPIFKIYVPYDPAQESAEQ